MQLQSFHQLVLHSKDTIQTCHWFLENHGNLISSKVYQFFFSKRRNFFTIKINRSIRNPMILLKKFPNRHGGLACPTSTLAHDSQRFPSYQRERHTLYCLLCSTTVIKI